MVRLLLPGNTS